MGKTEAVPFAASVAEAEAAALTLPPLDVHVPGGQVLSVKWVPRYKYLGASLQLERASSRWGAASSASPTSTCNTQHTTHNTQLTTPVPQASVPVTAG